MSTFVTRLSRRSFCAAIRPNIRQQIQNHSRKSQNVANLNVERLKAAAEQGARKGDIGLIVKSIRAVQNVSASSSSSSGVSNNSKREKYDHMRIIFRSVLEICAHRADAKTAARTFKAMEECQVKVDDVCRGLIVDAYANYAARCSNSSSSSSSSDRNVKNREAWDHLAGHRLIMADFAKQGDVKGAKNWMESKIDTVDPECFAHVVHAHLKVGDDASACSIWNDMLRCGIRPTLRAYTIVLNALVQRCERLNLISAGSNSSDSIRNCKNIRNCIEWFERIGQEGGLTPNVVAYNMMIQAHVKAEDSKEACLWFDKLLAARLVPTEISYNMILKSFANSGDPERAMTVLDNMQNAQLLPNQISFSTVLDAFARCTDAKAANRYLEKVYQQNVDRQNPVSHDDQPSSSDTREFTKRLVNANDSVATSILERMHNTSIKPHQTCWNTIIRFVAKTGDITKTTSWLEKMQQARCEPDLYSYNSVFAVFNRRADVLAAEQWMENIRSKSFQPDLVSVNSLLHVKALAADSAGAVATFEEHFVSNSSISSSSSPSTLISSKKKLRADEKSYCSVIDAFSKAGDPANALKWLQNLKSAGFRVEEKNIKGDF